MINPDFESTLVPEDCGKQNPEDSYTNKYQIHVPCSYRYNLLCPDDKFSKPSPLSDTQPKVLLTILLIVWSKKAGTVVK